MPKVALVLSGGGAKGAFQVAAERYAREVKGYKWGIIAGVSVGALNGSMLGMAKYQQLLDFWQTASNDRIYTGRLPDNLWTAILAGLKLVFGAKGLLGNKPLRE